MFCFVVDQVVNQHSKKAFWEAPRDEILKYLYRLVQPDYHLVLGAGISTFHRVLSFCIGTTDRRSLEMSASRTRKLADNTTVDLVGGCRLSWVQQPRSVQTCTFACGLQLSVKIYGLVSAKTDSVYSLFVQLHPALSTSISNHGKVYRCTDVYKCTSGRTNPPSTTTKPSTPVSALCVRL